MDSNLQFTPAEIAAITGKTDLSEEDHRVVNEIVVRHLGRAVQEINRVFAIMKHTTAGPASAR